MTLFEVNPRIEADRVHAGGRIFRKGVVYDAVKERIPPKRLDEMMALKMGEIKFFVPFLKKGTEKHSALRAEDRRV